MNSNNCGICMESLTDGRPITVLCSGIDNNNIEWEHSFHKECIQGWINANMGNSITCPICRREVRSIDLANLPLPFWTNIDIYLNAIHIIIPGFMIRNLVIGYQQYLEYERLHIIENLAFHSWVDASARVRNERERSGSPRFANLINSIGTYGQYSLARNSSRSQMNARILNSQDMIGLLIIFMIFNIFRNRYFGQRGGSNNMVLRIGNESINVPLEFKNTVKEAFDSIQKIVSKSRGRETRRSRR